MIAFLVILPLILTYALLGIWVERKLAGFIQDRPGPLEVGPFGLLQTLADILKLIQKEEIFHGRISKKMFMLAPLVIFISIIASFATIPLAGDFVGSGMYVGVFYLMAIVSLEIFGFLMAGWSSNNKFSLFGAMRAAAQMISYEVPVGLIVLSVAMIAQSLDLQEITVQQGVFYEETNYLFGLRAFGIDVSNIGGFLTWNIFRFPLLFVGLIMYFIGTLAEAGRAPFDIPEAESEIVAGFLTEYAGFRMAIIMLGEYAVMLLTAFLGVVLFLGGWNTPLPNIGSFALADWTSGSFGELSGILWGAFWLVLKAFVWVFVQMWVRWTYPRLRVDQLMYLCWKVLTPASLIIVLVAGVWRLLMI